MKIGKEWQNEIDVLKGLEGTNFFVAQVNLDRSYSPEFYELSGYHGGQGVLTEVIKAIGYFPQFFDDTIRLMTIQPDGSYGGSVYNLFLGVSAREWLVQWPNVDLGLVSNNDNLIDAKLEQDVMARLMADNSPVRIHIQDGLLSVHKDD